MKNSTRAILFIFMDYFLSIISWFLFYTSRKLFIEKSYFELDVQFYKGVIIIPFFWILTYTLQGTYIEIKRLYRSRLFNLTFIGTTIGVCVLFFIILLDDKINSYEKYYYSIGLLFIIQFSLIFIFRLIYVTIQVIRIQHGKDYFKTLIIGNSDKINEFYSELKSLKKSTGNLVTGVVLIDEISNGNSLEFNEIIIGDIQNIESIIKKNKIEDVIIVDNNLPTNELQYLLAKVSGLGINLKIKASDFDIALGTIKQNNLFGLLTKEIQFDPMPLWQKSIKRFLDLSISLISLIILFPFFIIIAIGVKKTSKGPLFFLQERIGINGIPFKIIKFRTMYTDSEKNGPQLSSSNDNRITKFGKFLRKTRIDEFPQFINVIKGDMSLVGPRPERQFYIDQIAIREPLFLQLSIVKPGITSWGQVKFGYAESVEQMIQRMRFDLLYLKNRSLALDFKIMFYTLITIIKAKGK